MSTEQIVNVPLLRKVMEHIAAHPEEWEQEEYAVQRPCGTAYCVAGTVAQWAGEEFAFECMPGDRIVAMSRLSSGERVEDFAREALGLSCTQAYHLFHERNTLPYLWTLAAEYTAGDIAIPEQFL